MRAPRILFAAVAALALLATPTVAMAADPTPTPETPATPTDPTMQQSVLTVLGTPITLDVTIDGTGHLQLVDLGGAPDTTTVASASAHKVRFVLDDAGTRVEVKAKHNKVETKISATTLGAISGAQSWSGQLFGPGNGSTTVTFTVGGTAGAPTITDVAVADATPGAPGEISDVTYDDHHGDDDEAEARVKIKLAFDHDGDPATEDATASVTIKVEVHVEDGVEIAKLKISARSKLISPDEGGPVGDLGVVINGGEPLIVPAPVCTDDDDDDHEGDHEGDHDDCDDHHERHEDDHDGDHHGDHNDGGKHDRHDD